MREKSLRIGFLGLGTMGEPMALNLARSGVELIVWNRTPGKAERLRDAGAAVAHSLEEVFDQVDVVILMLADGDAIDLVLGRFESAFATRVANRTIMNMGTTAPPYSRSLDVDIRRAGGRYVEAPVSGSRKPAEDGTLVAMLAGDDPIVKKMARLLEPISHSIVQCGPVPNALLLKLSVNLYLITMVTGLAEAVHFAEQHGLDMEKFLAILDSGPMASSVSKMKGRKLIQRDFAVQASILDVLNNSRLVADAARDAQLASPLLDQCLALYREAAGLALGGEDMAAVIHAIEDRTRGGAA